MEWFIGYIRFGEGNRREWVSQGILRFFVTVGGLLMSLLAPSRTAYPCGEPTGGWRRVASAHRAAAVTATQAQLLTSLEESNQGSHPNVDIGGGQMRRCCKVVSRHSFVPFAVSHAAHGASRSVQGMSGLPG